MPKARAHKLARARAKLERKLARGWQRAVFAAPQRPDETREPRVLPGPGPLDADSEAGAQAFAELWAAAEAAADEGLVKHSYVLDERRRVELDARHGHLKLRELDEAKIDKIMGGKQRPLRPDRSAKLLRAIGIMNADGTISARSAKKYKQVNHLVELCRPLWAERARAQPLRILDLACGNSYLAFVLLEALRLEGIEARLLGVDLRAELVEQSRARAREIGFGELARFECVALEQLSLERVSEALGGPPEVALSLHACDTATDAALDLAVRAGAEWIYAVPCCQAELARQLADGGRSKRASARLLPAALEHGLLRRSLGELLTDSLRVELLEACGYELAVVEFIASAHTPKNLLLRARKRQRREPASWPLAPVRARCEALGVEPTLLRTLEAQQS